MSLSFGQNPLLLLLCLAVAAGLTYWTYRHTVPAVAVAKRALLMAMRFLALFIVLFLLFEPVSRRIEQDERPPVLAVLIDESESLRLTSETTDEALLDLGTVVRETLRQIPAGEVDGDVRYYRFSGDVHPLDGDASGIDSLTFGGARTNISRALGYVRDELKDQNLGGVLLISDGQYNTGRNPLYLAERYAVPIYTVVVGDTTRQRDIQIRRVTTNEIAYVGTSLPIQVGLRVDDFPGQQVTVTLFQDSEALGSATVQLPTGTAEVPVDLTFEPKEEGLTRLTVAVTRLDGETTYRNNAESFAVRVLASKKRVLLLAAAPSPDLSALQQLLRADPNMAVSAYVQKRPGLFYEGSLPDSLEAFDVLLLAGYPGRAASADVLTRVAAAAENGTPLVFLLGHQTDLGKLDSALRDVLPVAPQNVRATFFESAFNVTPTGLQHPVLDLPDVPEASWSALPPLLYNESRWVASPDARVLATINVRGVPLDDPLLVLRSRAGQRTAALLGAGTWRWLNLPESLDHLKPFWPNLLSNLLRWVSTAEDDRPVRINPTADLFGGDEPVEFTGQVYDESLNPVDDASVQVEVAAEDGTQYPYIMDPVGNGRYTLDAGSLPEGTYRYTARAQRGGVVLGDDQGAFSVGALTLEFKETSANAPLMRQIAERSGGTFLTPGEIGVLPERLQASGTFAPILFQDERDVELWHLYGFLLAVILLLTLEWFLRKRSGMV